MSLSMEIVWSYGPSVNGRMQDATDCSVFTRKVDLGCPMAGVYFDLVPVCSCNPIIHPRFVSRPLLHPKTEKMAGFSHCLTLSILFFNDKCKSIRRIKFVKKLTMGTKCKLEAPYKSKWGSTLFSNELDSYIIAQLHVCVEP